MQSALDLAKQTVWNVPMEATSHNFIISEFLQKLGNLLAKGFLDSAQTAELLKRFSCLMSKDIIGPIQATELLKSLSYLISEDFIRPDQATELLKRITKIIEDKLVNCENVLDAFSDGQIKSKIWLVSTCNSNNLNLGTVFLCGGWLATILLHTKFRYLSLRSFDADPKFQVAADVLHRKLVMQDWKFCAIVEDIHNINYSQHTYIVKRRDGTICELTDCPDTIINTSCEHIDNFQAWFSKLPQDKLIILQSNDGFHIPGHINCSKNLEEFTKTTPLRRTIFSGELPMPQFNRFMRIGYK